MNVSVSLKAKGKGKLCIGAIHKRWSRLEMGQFILGGQRFTDEKRDEFIHYFNPGDMKPRSMCILVVIVSAKDLKAIS